MMSASGREQTEADMRIPVGWDMAWLPNLPLGPVIRRLVSRPQPASTS